MNAAWRVVHRRRAAAPVVLLGALCLSGAAQAADLPPYPAAPPPAPRVYSYRQFDPDPGPASSSGYYGYYGFDIGGTPYNGLYSASPVCLRSVPTSRGYRTVDVCRTD